MVVVWASFGMFEEFRAPFSFSIANSLAASSSEVLALTLSCLTSRCS